MWSLVVHLVSQDLSVAGKRAGLAGARSGLFIEQIRIIKEMRDADVRRGRTGKFIRPRFMVWENVPGAFSSNKGDDFRALLEETIRIAEPDAPDVPLPAKGKWPLADCWMGGGWSVAYRVLDAQFWGVPQRRRRIALVADFGGHAAPEILFVRESVCGDTAPGRPAGEETAAGAGSGAGQASAYRIGAYYSAGMLSSNPKAGIIPVEKSNTLDCNGGAPTSQQGGVCIVQPVICLNDQGGNVMGASVDIAGTLRAQEHGHQPVILAKGRTDYLTGWDNQEKRVFSAKGVAPTLSGSDGGGGRTVCGYIYDERGNGDGKTACTLTGDHQSRVTDYTAIVMSTGQAGAEIMSDASQTLNCNHEQPILIPKIGHTLKAKANLQFREDSETYIVQGIVRRLTPLECERLQGYPDGWTGLQEIRDMTDSEYEFWKSVLFEKEKREGRVRLSEAGVWEIWKYTKVKDEEDGGHWENTYKPYKPKEKSKMIKWYNKSFCKDSDSARYKALGNSIALPPWSWVLKRLCACYERTATMASLFDGIGGFPLIWERLNGPGSCLWASEIEEFPIAVTRRRFGRKEG